MRRIAIVTVGRSDYGVLRPLLRRIATEPELEALIIASSAHFDPRFGETYLEIESDGFAIAERVDCSVPDDSPLDIGCSMGRALEGFAGAYARLKPDLIVVLGDRYEMHAAATAAVPFLIPLAHFGGGASSRGAIDDVFRHSISKLSHLHFVEIREYAERLERQGEDSWRIRITGALGVDNVAGTPLDSLSDLNQRFGLTLTAPFFLATFHPPTRRPGQARRHVSNMIEALAAQPYPTLFTYPNADSEGSLIIEAIESSVAQAPRQFFAVPHLGTQGYYSAMALACCVVGNSSSGIIESASFRVPVVNIGDRQEGRFAPPNVIHCGTEKEDIENALTRVLDRSFQNSVAGLENPYGNGTAAEKIVETLKNIELNEMLLRK